MRAYILDKCTKKSVLRPGDDLERTIGDDDALVEIHATGLNQLDSKLRDGEFKPTLPYRPPFVLGHRHDWCVVFVVRTSQRQKREILALST